MSCFAKHMFRRTLQWLTIRPTYYFNKKEKPLLALKYIASLGISSYVLYILVYIVIDPISLK